jgi:hypothetical protein
MPQQGARPCGPWHLVFARSSSRSASTASITAFDSQLPDHSRAQDISSVQAVNVRTRVTDSDVPERTVGQKKNRSRMLYCRQPRQWRSTRVQLKLLGKLQKPNVRVVSALPAQTAILASIVASAPANPGHLLERVLIVLLAAAAGFILCSAILQKSDPLMGTQDAHFFSIVVAVLFAGVAWKLS